MEDDRSDVEPAGLLDARPESRVAGYNCEERPVALWN